MRPLLERLRDPSHAEADEPSSLGDLCREAADEIERLRTENVKMREKIGAVLGAFTKDEAQGYHSKDRQFAISILKD